MGRGKDKTIQHTDFPNMSPKEQSQVHSLIRNRGILPRVRVDGTATVRKRASGNVTYEDENRKGHYNEDKL